MQRPMMRITKRQAKQIPAPADGSEWEYQESIVKGGGFQLTVRNVDSVQVTAGRAGSVRTRTIKTRNPNAVFSEQTTRYLGRTAAKGVGPKVVQSWPAGWQGPWAAEAPKPSLLSAPDDVPPAFAKHWLSMQGMAGTTGLAPATAAITSKAWRPKSAWTIIDGDLDLGGNVIVATGKHDYGALLVRGDVRCRNLVVGNGFSFACSGDLTVKEAIVASAADSTCYVAGKVRARLVDSGSGAWLTIFSPAQLMAKHVSGYVMVGAKPLQPKRRADLKKLLVPRAVEREEWDAMDAEDREGEDASDYIRVDDRAAFGLLAKGGTILR